MCRKSGRVASDGTSICSRPDIFYDVTDYHLFEEIIWSRSGLSLPTWHLVRPKPFKFEICNVYRSKNVGGVEVTVDSKEEAGGNGWWRR